MEKRSTRILCLLIGPGLFALCCLALPASFGDFASRAALGSVAWMAFWWVTGPVDFAVTALLPIGINAFFQIADMSAVIANYSSETILLLLGASIISVTWEETGLDRRIAAVFMGLVGSNYRRQIVFWFLLSAALSAVLPNAVVCATMTPIAYSMLKYIGEDDIPHSAVGSKILLVIAYGAGVGGLASPLGGAMNLVVVDYLQQLTGEEFMYVEWVIRFLPIMLILLGSNLLFLTIGIKRGTTIGSSREYFLEQIKAFPKMTKEENWALWLFVVATVLAFTRQFYARVLPGMKPAYVFIICGIISFLVVKTDRSRLMLWENTQAKIGWDMMLIFGGGLAAGTLMNDSGAAQALGSLVADFGLTGGFFTILVIVTATLIMSDITSNTATAAVALPIVISIIQGIGKNPIPYVYIATIGVNLSYMMPTSIRAIPVGYGLQPKYMLKTGWKISVMVILLETILCYFMLLYWPAFSTTG